MTEKVTINDETYILPNNILTKKHKHRESEKWVSMWFYKDRQKTKVKKTEVKEDLIITSKLEYQKGIFYKLSQLSAEDDCFDYYYKLKEDIPTNVVKKNRRYKKGLNKNPKQTWKNQPPLYVRDKDGMFIVSFD